MGSNRTTGPRRHHDGHKGTKITKFLCVLCVLVTFVIQPSARQAAPTSAGWPQFRGNARLTGVASDAPATLSLKWTYEGGESFESSPAIADGVVYAGAGNGDLLAIDLETGKLRWKYSTGNLIGESSPAVGGGLVYIGDLSGVLHAVHAKDGSRAWTFKTGSEVKSSPVIAGERVLIGSYDTHPYAPHPPTGEPPWKLKTGGHV